MAPVGAATTGSVRCPPPSPCGFMAPVGKPRCPVPPSPVAGSPPGAQIPLHRPGGRAAAGSLVPVEAHGAWCDPTAPHCHLPWALPSHWASVPFRHCSVCRERPFPRRLRTAHRRFPHPGEEPPTRLCGPGPWSVCPLVPRTIGKSLKTTMCPGRRARESVRSSEPLGVWAWCIHPISAPGVGDAVLGHTRAGGEGLVLLSGPQVGPAAVSTIIPRPGSGWRRHL